MSTQHVALYIPNMAGYIRIVFVLLMLYHMRKRPILSFTFCILSGFIDAWDGEFARYFDQTSKLGQLLDIGMDRVSNFSQMFVLACIFPKYWLVFFTIVFVEFLKDYTGCLLVAYRFKAYIVASERISPLYNSLKQDVFRDLKIEITNKTLSSSSFNQIDSNNSFLSQQAVLKLLEHMIWYTGDIFCWLIYFGSFLSTSSQQQLDEPEVILHRLSGTFRKSTSYFNYFFCFLADMCRIFDDVAVFIEVVAKKLDFTDRFYNVVNWRLLLRVVGFICLVGAFLKCSLNFRELVIVYADTVSLDMKLLEW
jgi:hypothetical protein